MTTLIDILVTLLQIGSAGLLGYGFMLTLDAAFGPASERLPERMQGVPLRHAAAF